MFSWFHFLTYALVSAITPGPNVMMSMSNASRVGFPKAVRFNFGIWCGFSVVALLCTLFCSLLSSVIPKIKLPMLIIGAAYMLYLAWKTWKSTGAPQEKQVEGRFLTGFLLQFINPKLYIFIIVSLEAYILPSFADQPVILAAFALLLAFIGFCCTLVWAGFGSVMKLLFSKYARITNAIMALLLVYCAVSLFF